MEQNPNFRALLEGAYAQIPTLAGNFVKFSEFELASVNWLLNVVKRQLM